MKQDKKAMSNPLVIRNDKGSLATLTLNRPDKLNALTPQVFVELRKHIETIAQDTPNVAKFEDAADIRRRG